MRLHVSKGFTIIEVLVMSTLFLVLLSFVAQLFITAMHRTNDGRARVDLQQNGLFLLRQWERDIERTAPAAMRGYQGEATVVSLAQIGGPAIQDGQSIPGPGDDGYLPWRDQLVAYVYHSEERTFRRLVFEQSTPPFVGRFSNSRPLLPTPAELEIVAQSTLPLERVLSRDVEEFHLADSKGSQTSFNEQTLHLRIKLGKDLSSVSRRAEFTIERRYALRNRY